MLQPKIKYVQGKYDKSKKLQSTIWKENNFNLGIKDVEVFLFVILRDLTVALRLKKKTKAQ